MTRQPVELGRGLPFSEKNLSRREQCIHMENAMISTEDLKREARKYIRYEKDVENKIAYLTLDRPESINAATAGMRQVYADLVFQANIDDEVKVLVIRGEGDHFGGGGICRNKRICFQRRTRMFPFFMSLE